MLSATNNDVQYPSKAPHSFINDTLSVHKKPSSYTEMSAICQVICADGSEAGRDLSKDEMSQNLQTMYLREKPLLDKIKAMRLEYD